VIARTIGREEAAGAEQQVEGAVGRVHGGSAIEQRLNVAVDVARQQHLDGRRRLRHGLDRG